MLRHGRCPAAPSAASCWTRRCRRGRHPPRARLGRLGRGRWLHSPAIRCEPVAHPSFFDRLRVVHTLHGTTCKLRPCAMAKEHTTRPQNPSLIEAPWLVHGGYGA
jgi:hypothetical protein